MDKVGKIYCIDDQLVDEQVVHAENVFLVDCYEGGEDSGMLMEAARAVVQLLRQG